MLAIFLDTQTEIKEISHECDILKRKLDLVGQTTETEIFIRQYEDYIKHTKQ